MAQPDEYGEFHYENSQTTFIDIVILFKVHSTQGKPGKVRERFGKFIKSGKTWKTQGKLLENHSTHGKLRENFQTSVQLVDTITLCGT